MRQHEAQRAETWRTGAEHSILCHHIIDEMELLGGTGHCFETVWNVVKHVLRSDEGALDSSTTLRFCSGHFCVSELCTMSHLCISTHRHDLESGYEADTAQGLAPETKCLDPFEVLISFQLRCGVPVAQDRKVLCVDSTSIVLYLEQLEAAFVDENGDLGGTCEDQTAGRRL